MPSHNNQVKDIEKLLIFLEQYVLIRLDKKYPHTERETPTQLYKTC